MTFRVVCSFAFAAAAPAELGGAAAFAVEATVWAGVTLDEVVDKVDDVGVDSDVAFVLGDNIDLSSSTPSASRVSRVVFEEVGETDVGADVVLLPEFCAMHSVDRQMTIMPIRNISLGVSVEPGAYVQSTPIELQ